MIDVTRNRDDVILQLDVEGADVVRVREHKRKVDHLLAPPLCSVPIIVVFRLQLREVWIEIRMSADDADQSGLNLPREKSEDLLSCFTAELRVEVGVEDENRDKLDVARIQVVEQRLHRALQVVVADVTIHSGNPKCEQL